MGALFVTATGTDVGKSFVTVGIVRALRRRGRNVDALKPVMSGFATSNAAASDAGLLLAALGRKIDEPEIARVAPWRFAAPLSPDIAARREGRSIDFDALVAFCRRATADTDALLIEGIGGVMVPLDKTRTVLDWIAALNISTLLVAGSYLGTLSHTLTALDALRVRNVRVARAVVSESAQSGASLEETVETIARFAPAIPVIALPRLAPGAEHRAFETLADLV